MSLKLGAYLVSSKRRLTGDVWVGPDDQTDWSQGWKWGFVTCHGDGGSSGRGRWSRNVLHLANRKTANVRKRDVHLIFILVSV